MTMLVLDPVDAKVRVILIFTVPVRLNQGVPVLHGLFGKKANRNARAHARELLMVRKHECCSQEQNAEPRVRGVPLGRGEAVGKCRGHGVVLESDESLAAREGDDRLLDNEVDSVEPLDDGDEEVSDCEEDAESSNSQPRSLVTLKTLSRFGSKPNSSG